MSAHAELSPSASHRWLSCPGSVRLSRGVPPEPDSPYAAEGTAAHDLAEMYAREILLGREIDTADLAAWGERYPEHAGDEEMRRHAEDYRDYLRSRGPEVLFLEERLETGIAGCWGRTDAVLISGTTLEAVDYKYGRGIPVSPERNPQLMLYGLGALDTYGAMFGVDTVRLTVCQPRVGDGEPRSWELSADELRAWREEIRPVADQALNSPDAPVRPSDSACRWCPALGICSARKRALIEEDFGDLGSEPDLLTPDRTAEVLRRAPEIRSWLEAVERSAFRAMFHDGATVPGYKVVMRAGNRTVSDPEALAERLGAEGVEDVWKPREIKPLGALERLCKGRKRFETLAGDALTHKDPSPIVVPEDDDREAVTAVSSDFEALG